MPDWMPPTIAVAIITLIGTVIGVAMTRQTAKETNEITESDTLIKNLMAEVKRQDERLDRLDHLVHEQGQQIRDLQVQEWGLRRYVHKLLDFIHGMGHKPPPPPADLNL